MATDEQLLQPDGLSAEAIAALRLRLQAVRERIAQAAVQAGRKPDAITLVGVSKFFPAAAARAAVELGLLDLGENRVQEMLTKIDHLSALGLQPNWHLIGTLQKNKARQIIGRTHLIHSVDSLELLREIGMQNEAAQSTADILLQVNTSGEASKHGFEPAALSAAVEQAQKLAGIRLRGLMTMAPLFANPDDTLPIFEQTRVVFEKTARLTNADFSILSMGMSLDFEQAILCGSTHVRIGTAIFGPRLLQP